VRIFNSDYYFLTGMPDIRFGCTLCGECCKNHSLPLTFDEAIVWLEDRGNVAIFCEADAWGQAPPGADSRAQHRMRRSFGVACGSARARVTAILVGIVSGACKNLGDDLRCRIYETRPLVCRIYPAEISPFIPFDIKRKVCPPEAWAAGEILISDGKVVDPHMQWLVEKSRQTDHDDAAKKLSLCRDLNMDAAAIFGEGYVTYEPDRQSLIAALRKASAVDTAVREEDRQWRLYSPSAETNQRLQAQGFKMLSEKPVTNGYFYLHAPAAA